MTIDIPKENGTTAMDRRLLIYEYIMRNPFNRITSNIYKDYHIESCITHILYSDDDI
tara:strand:- start:66 stop:236 length:171 start_codon:yes stop_codon:yes gene_type:complete